jgi:membrane protein DedA with SNARE-associated domain
MVWHDALYWGPALLDGMGSPWAIALALGLTTLLVEDVAIAAGAALAAHGTISWALAFGAVGGGIALGDLGLYELGAVSTRLPLLRRYAPAINARLGPMLIAKLPTAVLIARVTPGLRFATYTACGFLRVSRLRFSAWVALAVTAWTIGLFVLAHTAGHALMRTLGLPAPLAVALPIVAVSLLLVVVSNRRGARTEVSQ